MTKGNFAEVTKFMDCEVRQLSWTIKKCLIEPHESFKMEKLFCVLSFRRRYNDRRKYEQPDASGIEDGMKGP